MRTLTLVNADVKILIAAMTFFSLLVACSPLMAASAQGSWIRGSFQCRSEPEADPRPVREAQTLTNSQVVTPWRATFGATSFLNCQVSLFYMAGSVF
jgi:hypothetical protein